LEGAYEIEIDRDLNHVAGRRAIGYNFKNIQLSMTKCARKNKC
jgi:hypothetical protein